MDTQSIKTSELTGPALRYAVAVAAGYEVRQAIGSNNPPFGVFQDYQFVAQVGGFGYQWQPDRDWSQLGPLIERYQVQLVPVTDGWTADVMADDLGDKANSFEDDPGDGETPLIAACRAIAASHWGEYADIPSELVQEQSDE